LVQYDIKKIIAYSTCSQLGLMFFICGLSCYQLGFFHLLTHACFKALLFLTAGALIHQLQDDQDFRKFGGLLYFLPYLSNIMILGSLALMGFPFLSGFYSKDLIIENIFFLDYNFSFFFKLLICLITLGTCLYSLRLVMRTFFFIPNGYLFYFRSFHNNSFFIFFTLFILTILSIFVGFFLSEIFAISGNLFFNTNILILSKHDFLIENEFMFLAFK
jgi:NADH-ubiquinone oxidoreductase chain 5